MCLQVKCIMPTTLLVAAAIKTLTTIAIIVPKQQTPMAIQLNTFSPRQISTHSVKKNRKPAIPLAVAAIKPITIFVYTVTAL